ncbi:MAG: hypothetical protein M5U26_13550 [Planctomycetota bacterium]|nr:hypothetical protein [Planctomycetota bacterium]
MHKPEFTWWPWRVWALGVPILAAAGALAAATAEVPGRKPELVGWAVLLVLFGAGNGLLLGAAIGDFGRALLSTALPAAAAILSVELLGGFSFAFGLPLTVLALGASLSMDASARSAIDAAIYCLVNLLVGAAAGFLLFGVTMIFTELFLARIGLGDAGVAVGAVAGLTLGNVIFVARVFRAAYRVESEREIVEPPEPAPVDTRRANMTRLLTRVALVRQGDPVAPKVRRREPRSLVGAVQARGLREVRRKKLRAVRRRLMRGRR